MTGKPFAPTAGTGLIVRGPVGAGKSTLLSRWATEDGRKAALLSPQTQARVQSAFLRFHQERMVSFEDPHALLVRDLLLRPRLFLHGFGRAAESPLPPVNPGLLDWAMELSGLRGELLTAEVSRLSHGELRRTLLARSLMEGPELLLLDDPLGGVDPDTRPQLERHIAELPRYGIAVAVALAREDEQIAGFAEFTLPGRAGLNGRPELRVEEQSISSVPRKGTVLASFRNVEVTYGTRRVLGPIDWELRAGESWLVTGPNGSGKSTLLGLLLGDHPQLFCNQVELFGERPGHGFSVWEHRQRTAFVSPEMQGHYGEDLPAWECVFTGMGTTNAVLMEPLRQERLRAVGLLDAMGLQGMEAVRWTQLSWGERRLVLLARALMGKRPLVVLDEPTSGLDRLSVERVHALLQQEAIHTTFVIASHHPQECPEFVQKRIVLPLQGGKCRLDLSET